MELIIPKDPDPNDRGERNRFLRDMKREMEQDLDRKPLAGTERNTCRCGHRLGEHYQGTRAMPCSKCRCSWCECENAEVLRRDRARKGVQDVTPHPEFDRRRGR